MNSNSKFEKYDFLYLLNMFYKMVDRIGYDNAISFMEKVYPTWEYHWQDVMLAYDYEYNNLKRGVE